VSVIAVIIIVFVLLVVLLIVGGLIANARRTRAQEDELHVAVREADQALALARAGDRGWDRDLLEAAAREAFAARSPVEVRELMLLQVVDRPGTEEDQALFRVITDAGSEEILLVRQGDGWGTPGLL
jgi:flagellar biosynthesis/type III secretory pathway M-ring protein FliF/YscJ